MSGLWIFLGVVGLVVVFLVSLYNRLVVLRQRVANGFAQIDVQLKRRHELIPSLVEVAKGYMGHENETLVAVVEARSRAVDLGRQLAEAPGEIGKLVKLFGVQSKMSSLLARLMVVVEGYPDLKADVTMLQLSEEVTSTENRIAFSRQAYNDAVMFYNTRREVFPSSVVAVFFGFKEEALWVVEDRAEVAVPGLNLGV